MGGTDLHATILTRLAELRATAQAAARDGAGTEVPFAWPASVIGFTSDWLPDAVLRWLDWADEVARRHEPVLVYDSDVLLCGRCRDYAGHLSWPCPEIAGLARALDVTP